MCRDYSEWYEKIDQTKYTFKEDGIYSNCRKKKIDGYAIGEEKKYYQTKFYCSDGKEHSLYLHVALWVHFNGKIPDGMEINHHDENTANNVLSNLELMTHQQNMNHGDTQKRKAEGIRNSEKIKQRRKNKGFC